MSSILSFQVDPVATAVLNMVSQLSIVEKMSEWPCSLKSSTWYNGRERGVCLYTNHMPSDRLWMYKSRTWARKHICIVFGENRNSDDIFVDHWYETNPIWMNPPRLSDMTEERYRNRKFFKTIEAAVACIDNLLESL